MTNLDIAQSAKLRPIGEVAELLGLNESDFEPLGRHKGKLTHEGIQRLSKQPAKGKLILVTATTPTPAGEGKTTMTVGLSQGLRKIGKNAMPATREPALGPIFGIKGGACGGGYSQVLPMEEINLFFNGDFPAIQAAHNLLSAMLDAHIHNGNELNIDIRQPMWPRTLDMNDRALRDIVIALGGKGNGFPRSDGFVITPASEVMAILCLARSVQELKERLGRIHVAVNMKNEPVTAADLKANGAMSVLLRDAIRPNVVQTIEGGPAFVHGGPFGNIAHGCSSILATECGLKLADYVVTEGGFAADLGAEKFLNIVCRSLGRGPDAIVLVTTVRSLAHHGDEEGLNGIKKGFENLKRHVQHLQKYGPPIVVAVNKFAKDTQEELDLIVSLCNENGLKVAIADPWGSGGEGCKGLAELVASSADSSSQFKHLYPLDEEPECKMEYIARGAYGAIGVELSAEAKKKIAWAKKHGLGNLPICMAKTQYSLSDDAKAKCAPENFKIHIREVRPSAGAGFLVAVSGEIMLMPGLGGEPAAHRIDIDDEGKIIGLF